MRLYCLTRRGTAVETLSSDLIERLPGFRKRMNWFLRYRPDVASLISRWQVPGVGNRHLLSLLRGHRMKQLLRRMLDESEFLSASGVSALSKYHEEHPYRLQHGGVEHTVTYQPGDSDSGLFGENSHWRGPIWMPVNYLLVESLRKFHAYYGDDFRVECPTGSGTFLSLGEVADELSARFTRLFLVDASGCRPSVGEHPLLQADPNFRDYLQFHEYFHGDNDHRVCASHQTGWTEMIFACDVSGTKMNAARSTEDGARMTVMTEPRSPSHAQPRRFRGMSVYASAGKAQQSALDEKISAHIGHGARDKLPSSQR